MRVERNKENMFHLKRELKILNSLANRFYFQFNLQSEVEEELEPHERKKLKKLKAVSDSEEEEDGEFLVVDAIS